MAALYTGRGDGGFTDTITQRGISKADPLICLIGTIDEAAAALGLAKASLPRGGEIAADINRLLQLLSLLMGELAGGETAANAQLLSELERKTDGYKTEFDGFSAPGENLPSAHLNMARCIVRRAERIAAELLPQNRISPDAAAVLNRLSDLIYAMSRCAEKI